MNRKKLTTIIFLAFSITNNFNNVWALTDSTVSTALSATAVKTTNNYGPDSDTIQISSLTAGDKINIYSVSTGGSAYYSKTVDSTTFLLTGADTKFNSTGGTIYVSVTKSGKTESKRTAAKYLTEPVSTTLSAVSVKITNNSGTSSDSIVVNDLPSQSTVSIYSAAKGGTLISSEVSGSNSSTTLKPTSLLEKGGTVYVALTEPSKLEGKRTAVKYLTEISSPLTARSVATVNQFGSSNDSLTVSGLTTGDTISVYSAASGGTSYLSSKASSSTLSWSGSTTTFNSTGGTIYVSITKENKTESKRTAVKYVSEPVTTALTAKSVTVHNNSGTSNDTVEVFASLNSNDTINIYSAAKGGTPITSEQLATSLSSVSIPISNLAAKGGTIYVSLTKSGNLESKRTSVKYLTEISSPLTAKSVAVTNGSGTNDIITVSGLASGDKVCLYSAASGTTALLTAAVVSEATSAMITSADLSSANITLVPTGGTIYLSLIKKDKAESKLTPIKYLTEPVSTSLSSTSVTVSNGVGTNDKVTVTGLSSGDVIKVYTAATSSPYVASDPVASNSTSVEISNVQLNASGGTIYVSLTGAKTLESKRTAVKYTAEPTTTALLASAVTVNNNSGTTNDSILVTNLAVDDVISVYSAATSGTPISVGTVSAAPSITLKPTELLTSGGTIYVSVKKADKRESARTAVKYDSEISKPLTASSITVTNSTDVTNDRILVSGLLAGDKISLYSGTTSTTAIAVSTVTDTTAEISGNNANLISSGGTLYLSVTKADKGESTKTAVKYASEPISTALASTAVTVDNNVGNSDDMISVSGVTAGDKIYIYSAATSGDYLSSTVAAATTAVASLDSLASSGGTIYVSIEKSGLLESKRTAIKYNSEVSTALAASTITVINNYGTIDDTVVVSKLNTGDIIELYAEASGGVSFASEQAANSSDNVTISTDKLANSGGTIYVSVTKAGILTPTAYKSVSSRTAVKYDSENSTAISNSYVRIINNYGSNDTITVSGLTTNDIVNVYSSSEGGVPLTSSVPNGATSVTINDNLLNDSGGTVYISVVKGDKGESSRTPITYASAPITSPLKTAAITVTNNPGPSVDIVTVTSGISAGDTIYVYSTESGGTAISSIVANGTIATMSNITVPTGGTIYVSVKDSNKLESARVLKTYTPDSSN